MERNQKIVALATSFITLGETIANVYNKTDKADDTDSEELAELEAVHKAASEMVDAARLRKSIPHGA